MLDDVSKHNSNPKGLYLSGVRQWIANWIQGQKREESNQVPGKCEWGDSDQDTDTQGVPDWLLWEYWLQNWMYAALQHVLERPDHMYQLPAVVVHLPLVFVWVYLWEKLPHWVLRWLRKQVPKVQLSMPDMLSKCLYVHKLPSKFSDTIPQPYHSEMLWELSSRDFPF